MLRLTIICLLIIACTENVACKKLRQENSALQSEDNASGKRTLMISNLLLLPIFAGVGIKFLVLLPIILSKIALLGIMSFVSSNLSLLVSAILGIRSYFFDDKPTEEDYDYDGRYKNRYESHKPHKYASSKDPHDGHRHHEDNYDPHDKYMHRYKGHELSHPGYNSYHPEYRYHDDHEHSKKRFRPFKLLDRIKDAIKDHFQKSRDHRKKYREYDDDYKHDWYELSDDHNEYTHEMHGPKYKDSDHSMKNYQSSSRGKNHEGYMVPQDWSHKDEVASNNVLKSEQQDHSNGVSSALIDGQLKIPVKSNAGEPMPANLNLTQ